MLNKVVFGALLLFASSCLRPANAGTIDFTFAGPGVSGNIDFTYGTTTDGKYPGGYLITGATGTFTDTNNSLGLINVMITGVEPLALAAPDPTNMLAPDDFSKYAASGLPADSDGAITYDDLYYPGGSPPAATDYPFGGGIFDIYGLLFTIGNGTVVDLWSNGLPPGAPMITYGVAVAKSGVALDYVTADVLPTPEPGGFGLLGLGLGGIAAWRMRSKKRA